MTRSHLPLFSRAVPEALYQMVLIPGHPTTLVHGPRHSGGTTARLAATARVKPGNLGNSRPPPPVQLDGRRHFTPPPDKAWGTMIFPTRIRGKLPPSRRLICLDASLQPSRRITNLQKSNCAAFTGRPTLKCSPTHFIFVCLLCFCWSRTTNSTVTC